MALSTLIFLATDVASTEVFSVLIALIAADLVRRRSSHTALLIVLGTIGAMLSVIVLKTALMAQRPTEDQVIAISGYGFPSGHSTAAAYLAMVLYVYAREYLGVPARVLVPILLALALIVGTSRVYLGVHTPVQVLGGYLLGFLWSLFLYYFYKKSILS